jgi:hypothetical protein
MLVVADRGELAHDPALVEVLELLAAQTATAWTTAATLAGLRTRPEQDPLTRWTPTTTVTVTSATLQTVHRSTGLDAPHVPDLGKFTLPMSQQRCCQDR